MTGRRPRRRVWRRLARVWAAAGVMAVVGSGVAGCGNSNGVALARQACQHVDRSLTLYRDSLHAPSPAVTAARQAQALAQLRDAMPIAATAAGEAGQFQALMSTLEESDHLPESLLVHALGEQCAAANSNGAPVPTPQPTAGTPATRPPSTGL
jgi:hypothetical protein